MATVGRGILRTEAFAFFDALRSYDVEAAVGNLAEDAVWQGPDGVLHGRAAIQEHLEPWLGGPETRPSLTIRDVTGDGTRVALTVRVSGRFGRAPRDMLLTLLCTAGKVVQATLWPLGKES